MFRKIVSICVCFAIIFLCGCSQESKFGVQQFVERMNSQYGTDFATADFILGTDENEENYLFCERGDMLISLSLDTNNTIRGVGLLLTESMDINDGLDTFLQICCVFMGENEENQRATLKNCQITEEKIKYADSNFVITVGKFKYSVICNNYSVTLFCDRT